jgi:hypothetical protein
MKIGSIPGWLVAGLVTEGYVILCSQNGDEYSFLVKSLGISVECPHCGATDAAPNSRRRITSTRKRASILPTIPSARYCPCS